jgi:hypothetical protein
MMPAVTSTAIPHVARSAAVTALFMIRDIDNNVLTYQYFNKYLQPHGHDEKARTRESPAGELLRLSRQKCENLA